MNELTEKEKDLVIELINFVINEADLWVDYHGEENVEELESLREKLKS